MGFWRFVRDYVTGDAPAMSMAAPTPAAKFAVEVPPEMLEAMTGDGALAPRISRSEALQVPAVLRARNMIAGTLSSLPHQIHGPDKQIIDGTYLLGGNIDPDVPNSVVFAQTYEDLLFEGISWWRVTGFGWHSYPVTAVHVPVGSVHVAPVSTMLPSQMRISADQPFPATGKVFIDGVPVPDREVIRFDSPNPPLLRHAARAIRAALRLDRTAAMYADEPLPQIVLEALEGTDTLDDTPGSAGDGTDRSEIDVLLDRWVQARRTRSAAYMGGVKANVLGWSPEQLQLASARQHAVLEISRAAGVDPEDLGVSTTSRTYANQEQRWQAMQNLALGPYVTAVQDRLSMRDLLPRGYVTRVNFAAFLRSDMITRYQAYEIAKRVGVLTLPEIRDLEDRRPLTPAERAAVQPAAVPQQPPQPAVRQEADTPMKTFSDDENDIIHLQFDDTETAEAFQVDVAKRTIIGLVVPWGRVARSGFFKWRFAPDSLKWSDTSRVKLNMHHDRTQLIGRATRLQSGSRGLQATFKIANGTKGDNTLDLAQDKILDGFSIEIDFDDPEGWQPDPSDETVRLVKQASLRGVALTGMPAFDDARVSRVAATRQGEGTIMPEDKQPDAGQPGANSFDLNEYLTRFAETTAQSHRKLTEELGKSLGDGITAGFKAALENMPAPQTGPEPVRAARFQVTYEPPVYRFSGIGHSLVRDAYHATIQNDQDAKARLRKYEEQTTEMAKLAAAQVTSQFQAGMSAQFAPIDTTGAAAIIPPGYRPDLYVSELLRGRPLVNATSRGSIDNASPFTVPVFSSSNGVGDHTEGVNPADGLLAFTTKTVSPGGISGKLVLTREIVDSSNPAIDQIALATMREAYARQTEAKVYDLFNGVTGAGGAIAGDFVPSGAQASTVAAPLTAVGSQTLIKHIRERLAKYPFNRFNAPDTALMGQNATTRLATAEGNDGRPLLPSVGAQNTVGLGNSVRQAWFIDGIMFQPAWAQTGVGVGDSQILMLNQADAWVWESPLLAFQFNEKQGPANIELAVFGYFGTHLLRPVGLSGIRIT